MTQQRRFHGDDGAVSLETEPVGIMAAVNAAISSTLGVLTITGVLDEKVAGGVGVALAAWILVAAMLITRPRVASPLTQANLQAELDIANAKAAKPAKP